MTLAVAGASGFVGAEILRAAARARQAATPIAHLAVGSKVEDPEVALQRVARGPDFARLVAVLRGHRAVINAAGAAVPASRDVAALTAANVTWPLVLSAACRQAGVQRLIHISSAAVQGRMDPLDETLQQQPFSPYSASKAEGERRLLALTDGGAGAAQLCLHRPTSVQGPGRDMTRRLQQLSLMPFLPMNGPGGQPLPLALIGNVAAAALFLADAEDLPAVALQPWEGLTTAMLYHAAAPGVRRVPVPPAIVSLGLWGSGLLGRVIPRVGVVSRYAELLMRGQRVAARALEDRGFRAPHDVEKWRALLHPVTMI